jgi:nucleoside-diphosphate-sugar epimerase
VTIINDDLCNIEKYADLLKRMDCLIHLAIAWGGDSTFDINCKYTLILFNLLDLNQCEKIIYFSTASILDSNNQLLVKAGTEGTSYIRSKYFCYKKLPELKIYDRIITLFPTLVFAGNRQYPQSHISRDISKVAKWINIIRFFKVDSSFHFIHACDVSLIVKHLLESETEQSNFVLGNKSITVGQFIKEICEYLNKKVFFQINLSSLLKMLAIFLKNKFHPWNLFCFRSRYFRYKVVNTSTFNIKSDYQTIRGILKDFLNHK